VVRDRSAVCLQDGGAQTTFSECIECLGRNFIRFSSRIGHFLVAARLNMDLGVDSGAVGASWLLFSLFFIRNQRNRIDGVSTRIENYYKIQLIIANRLL